MRTNFTDEDRARLREATAAAAKRERARLAARSPREVLYDYIIGLASTVCGEFCGGGCACDTDDPKEINQLIDDFAAQVREEL